MKHSLIALLLLFGLTVAGQDNDFTSGMKTAAATMGAISKAEKKTGPQITSAGERLGSIYENMIPFWRQRNAADAVKISEQGKIAAAQLASAAFGNDEAKVTTALQTLGGTCKACHEAHRDKTPEGKYKIK